MKKPDLRSLKEHPQDVRKMAENIDPGAMRQVQQVVEQYQGKSEAELLTDLQAMVSAERAAGTLTNARIDSIAAMLAPMLDPAQKQRMQTVMQQLKKD